MDLLKQIDENNLNYQNYNQVIKFLSELKTKLTICLKAGNLSTQAKRKLQQARKLAFWKEK